MHKHSIKKSIEKFREYHLIRQTQIDCGKNDYSLINSLLRITDEVHLHSKFIFSMISPDRDTHYFKDEFLRKFIQKIDKRIDERFNYENAFVHREKGNIDLLISDGETYIIVENKLRAVDQKNQLSRYIDHVLDHYDLDVSNKNIKVVYLSDGRSRPKKSAFSLEGYEFPGELAVGERCAVAERSDQDDDTNLKKVNGFCYYYISYQKSIRDWACSCKELVLNSKKNPNNLIYAFDEYLLILDKLDKTKSWRNVMTLPDYYRKLKKDKDENEMYEFMLESKKCLGRIQAEELIEVLEKAFSACSHDTGKWCDPKDFKELNPDADNPKIKKLTLKNCEEWIKKKGYKENWKNKGVVFKCNEVNWVFVLATEHVYLCNFADSKSVFTVGNRVDCSRSFLTKKDGFVDLEGIIKKELGIL